MNKPNSRIGKLVFAITVAVVLFKDNLPWKLDPGTCISLLLMGFCIMLVGSILDDIQQLKNNKAEEDKRRKRIKSLYGKE